MRKLLTILFLFIGLIGFGQARSWTTVTYSGSSQAWVYKPAGYDSRSDWPVVYFLHGQGEVGTNINSLLTAGLPLYIQNGADFPFVVFCPQISTGTWDANQVQAGYTYLTSTYGSKIDENEVHLTGLSLGGGGTYEAIAANPDNYASGIIAAGTPRSVATGAIENYRKVPMLDFHGTADNTQNMSLFNVICDSLWNRSANDPDELQVLPRNVFVWNVGHSSTIWNDSVYAQWNKWSGWALLHHKSKDTTAQRYVDSLHNNPSWDFYWQAKRAVDALSSGSFKTSLQADLATEYAAVNGTGAKRYVLDFGVSGKTTSGNVNNLTNGATGTVYSSLIDDGGTTSSIGLTVVSRVNSGTVTVDKGVPGTYFGLAQNTMDDSWEVYNNGGTLKFTGLNNSKQYHVRILGASDQTVSASIEFGIKATIAGTQKVIRSGFRSFNRYMEWRNVSPTSGEISIAFVSYVTNGWGSLNAIELVEVGTGNESPVADAGADQFITQPTSTTTLTGSGTDVDGTIASYLWTKLSGPSCTIVSASSATTNVTGMSTAGTYVFQLQVTDNGGSTGVDQMTVTVNASSPVVANAGADQTIPVGKSVAVLDGSNSTGTGLSYSWRLITTVYGNTNGAKGKIQYPSSARTGIKLLGYWPGGYNYELTVTDGTSTDKDTVNVYVSWPEIPSQNTLNGGVRLATTQDSIDVAQYNPGACRVGYDVMVTGANGYGISGGDSVGSNYLSIYIPSSAMPTTDTVTGGVRMFIKGGVYRRIEMVFSDAFKGTVANPNIITYYGARNVKAQEFIIASTGSFNNVQFRGDYVPGVCGTPAYQGHKTGYAFSRGKYGFEITNDWSSLGTNGLDISVTNNVTNLEIMYVELGEGNFNSFNLKKNSTELAYTNVKVHDILMHGSGGEGLYIGETASTDVTTAFYGLKVYNNRILYSGNESVQIGKLYDTTLVNNNVVVGGGLMGYSAFGTNQDGIFQLGYVAGKHTIRNNIFQGSFQGAINQGNRVDATSATHTSTDSVKYLNNLWIQAGGDNGGYSSGTSAPNTNMVTYWDSCWFGQMNFTGNRVYANTQATNKAYIMRSANNAKYAFRNTKRDGTKTQLIATDGGTPTYDTVTATVTTVASPQYVNSGFSQNFDWGSVQNYCDSIYKFWGWEPTTGLSGVVRIGEVKTYDSLEYCMFMGKFYRSKHGSNSGNMPIGETDSHWEKLTWTDGVTTYDYPPEDYRLVQGDPYQVLGMGLTDYQSTQTRVRKRIRKLIIND